MNHHYSANIFQHTAGFSEIPCCSKRQDTMIRPDRRVCHRLIFPPNPNGKGTYFYLTWANTWFTNGCSMLCWYEYGRYVSKRVTPNWWVSPSGLRAGVPMSLNPHNLIMLSAWQIMCLIIIDWILCFCSCLGYSQWLVFRISECFQSTYHVEFLDIELYIYICPAVQHVFTQQIQ